MKLLSSLFCLILLAGCTAQSSFRAIGARNAAGAPVGDYRVVNAAGATQSQGRFQDGKMDGSWVFFDSHQVKLAEVTYRNGVSSGSYRTFFGSLVHPASAGKLESQGTLQNGQVVHQHIAYNPDGQVFSNAILEAGTVRHVTVGPREAAAQTAAADTRFVQTLEGAVHSAIH